MKSFKTSARIPTLFLILALGIASFNTFSADLSDANKKSTLDDQFSNLDTDGNASLSWSEVEKGKGKLFTRKNFTNADINHDDVLSQDEYTAYKNTAQKKAVKLTIADSTITAKAKTKILRTKGLKSLQISVETHEGEVLLSGFVDSEAAKAKAGKVVSNIEGVKSVKNSLEVKS